eukprot:GILI01014036.1.p1 GENE.GILI01014036.1~~GILI01014036.1.p1  ORF type:complete len:320 (-),score=35.59 GILI01014036.1:127-1086(-)
MNTTTSSIPQDTGFSSSSMSRKSASGRSRSFTPPPAEGSADPSRFLKTRTVVGGIKTEKLNYTNDQKAFLESDVPAKASDAKQYVVELKKPNILGERKPQWNKSTEVAKTNDLDLKRTLLKVRAGLMDEPPLPAPKPRTAPMTTSVDHPGDWNLSTFQDPRERRTADFKRKVLAQEHSQRITKNLNEYLSPEEQQNALVASRRKLLEDTEEMRQQLREQYLFEEPGASEARVVAVVHKRLEETLRKTKAYQEEEPACFDPDMSKTNVSRKYKAYFHPGRYEYSAIEQRDCWSCCMNFDADSKGCSFHIRNPDSWCLTSY